MSKDGTRRRPSVALVMLALLGVGLLAAGTIAVVQAAAPTDDGPPQASEEPPTCFTTKAGETWCAAHDSQEPSPVGAPSGGDIQEWLGTVQGGASVMAAGGLQVIGVMVAYKRGWRELVSDDDDDEDEAGGPTAPAATNGHGALAVGASHVIVKVRCLECGFLDTDDASFCSGCAAALKPGVAAKRTTRA